MSFQKYYIDKKKQRTEIFPESLKRSSKQLQSFVSGVFCPIFKLNHIVPISPFRLFAFPTAGGLEFMIIGPLLKLSKSSENRSFCLNNLPKPEFYKE